jgi:hypothetical protein
MGHIEAWPEHASLGSLGRLAWFALGDARSTGVCEPLKDKPYDFADGVRFFRPVVAVTFR